MKKWHKLKIFAVHKTVAGTLERTSVEDLQTEEGMSKGKKG